MNTLSMIITAVVSFVTALGGSSILYIRQNRRLKEIEVESRQSDEWKRLYETSDRDSREKNAKIDALYAERQKLLYTIIDKEKSISMLKVDLERSLYDRCVINDCLRRNPPRRNKFNQNQQTKNHNENETTENPNSEAFRGIDSTDAAGV